MARNKHTAAETIRERVGKGYAVTDYIYNAPISKPAKVIEGSANPEVVGSMSDTKEAQGVKIVVGLLMTVVTWLLVGAVAMLAYSQGARLTLDIVGFVYVATFAILTAVSLNQYNNREKSSFEQVTWITAAVAILLMLRSLYLGTEEKTAMLIIAFWVAALNPWGLAKLIAGMGGWNDANVTRDTLYVNERTVYAGEGALPSANQATSSGTSDEPILVGVRDNGQLMFPAVNGLPFLVRQVEDFCYTAMPETVTEKGPGSGLAREAMLNQMIGPRNNTVANRPQSYIKVTRGIYDAIMAGLYASGLVVDGPKGAASWAKIKDGTAATCGYSIHEIRTQLLAHSSQSIGK